MADTTLLQLPLLAAAQAQKHVTVNEALLRLDALVQLAVKDRDLTEPPGNPSDGDRYIPASGATGTWDGWDLNIAWYVDGVWTKLVPRAGWLAWVEDEEVLLVHDGSGWIDLRPAFRGCLAHVGSNMTGQDFSGGLTAIPMSDEAYDTGGFHENVTNPSRLTVPAGVSMVEVAGQVALSSHNLGADCIVAVAKNGGADYPGCPILEVQRPGDSTASRYNVRSPPLSVVEGDYFELMVHTPPDSGVTINDKITWLAVWIVA